MESVFGDIRLDKRLEKMKQSIEDGMNASLPQVMGSWAELKASYRFFK